MKKNIILKTYPEETKNLTPKQIRRKNRLESSKSYQLAKQIGEVLDVYHLDGVIGLIPVIGDVVTQTFSIVYLYIAIVKIRSWRLSAAIVLNSLLDIMIGLVPYLGIVMDFFYKSNVKNIALIRGFAENDRAIVKKVNKKAAWSVLFILILLVVIYFLVRISAYLVSAFYHWVLGLM